MKDAAKFIKFALGENVKQSNWSSYSRFPQSRMGVDQVYVDFFQRAKEYGEQWDKYNSLSKRDFLRIMTPLEEFGARFKKENIGFKIQKFC